MFKVFRKIMLTIFMLIALPAHSTDQKPLSNDQLNALYFFNVASLAVDKCGYQTNTDLFKFIFGEYELTEDHTDPDGLYAKETALINQQADQFMKNTSCEKLAKLFGINGEALPGMLNIK